MLLLNLEHRGGLLGDTMHKWFLKAYQCEKQSCKNFLPVAFKRPTQG